MTEQELRERLATLEQFSDAWMEVWRQLQQFEEPDDRHLDIIQAHEAGRQYARARRLS
jgi:hypothetical protein